MQALLSLIDCAMCPNLNKIFPCIVAMIFLFQCGKIYADDSYLFTHLDVRQGLPENCVKSIVQDKWGFMWFGTKNGLGRYDSNGIKCYSVDDKLLGVGNHNVSALYAAPDGNLWVGTDKGVYIFNPYDETFSFFNVETGNGHSITDWISQIESDKDGNVWIISPMEGAFRYNMLKKTLTQYKTAYEKPAYKNNPQCMCVRENGEVWIGTNGAGLFLYDKNRDDLTQYVRDDTGYSVAEKNVYVMCNFGNKLIVGEHEDKLLAFDLAAKRFTEINSQAHYKVIRALLYDGINLYIGTNEGLFIINRKGEETHVSENHALPYSLSDNVVMSMYMDNDKGLWLGTNFGGVNYMPRTGIFFRDYVPTNLSNSFNGRRVREMATDANGKVWISSEDGMLNVYNPTTHTFELIDTPKYDGGTTRLGLMADGDKMWSGVFKNGLDVIDINTKRIAHYTPSDLNIEEGSVYALYKDSKGRIWLGSGNGVYIKTDGMKFAQVETLPLFFVQDIAEDRYGNIWIATMGNGAFCYNPQTGRHVNYSESTMRGNSISSNSISSITFDKKGNIWFSTDRGGICKYDLTTKQFSSYSKDDGLPDDIAYKILEDEDGYLWFGTNHGMVRFDEEKKNVTVYNNSYGLSGDQYSYKSATKVGNGDFIFGKVDGIVMFNPHLAKRNNNNKKVFITNVNVNNEEIKPAKRGILSKNILFADEIRLPHDFSNLSFCVSSVDFSSIENNNYEYMLSGVDKTWVKSKNHEGNILYSRLQPGTYTFKIRREGCKDNVTELRIVVAHPWYTSLLAIIIYVLIAAACGYYLYRVWQKKQLRRLAFREQQYRDITDKEILNSKINFFTNITHEIRTPLTLINGSLENIMSEKVDNPKVSKNLAAIGNNCERLLDLANQLLDFRKLNTNTMTLYFTNVDISAMLRGIIKRFEPEITRGHKKVSLDMEDENLTVPIDREAVTKIISNLLNNARKYSETFISIHVEKLEDDVEIVVINDGEKIPDNKAEEIFNPFVQLDKTNSMGGSGMGLSLARSLAELHSGKLEVDVSSEYNKFVLRLPMHQENIIHMDEEQREVDLGTSVPSDAEQIELSNDGNQKEYTILIVEDNAELLQMLNEKLEETYNTITVPNGKEAIRKLENSHVDIIISDIIMPVMNGLEMTRELKSNIEFNHIPIILLTAKNTIENHIEGLKAGADAYVDKPFKFTYLLAEIETILENRRRERESFLHKPYIPVQNTNINRQNEEFLRKMSELIIANIKSPDFNVERLGADMCMSRSSLHRKIKEVSDLTPIDFIKLIRLKKAAELIQEYDYRTNEVCEMVGINSPSYFIKLFQKQFGMTPKEFSMNCRKKRGL